jgi:peptide/nickel transport system substrate-binding protein
VGRHCSLVARPALQGLLPRETHPPLPRATKTVSLSSRLENRDGIALFSTQNADQRGTAAIFHAGLTVYDVQGRLQPVLAQKVPSVTDGDWKVNPDGSMEVTWKIKPTAKWHDGEPLVADDFLFGLELQKDKDLPNDSRSTALPLIQRVTAPDPQTLIINWSETYFGGNEGNLQDQIVMPAPRHLVGDLYAQGGDKQPFINSPYWTSQFVGAGPYKLGEWVLGSYTEGLAFDGYVLGRPKIDRVIVRYIPDINVAVSTLLAGQVDVANVGLQHLDQVKSTWGSTGGTILQAEGAVSGARLQHRDPTLPWARDVRARRALLQLIDRQSLADTFATGGLGAADLYVAPTNPVYKLIEERGYMKYPYDPVRGAQLMGEAGWTKGVDGVFRDAAGQPFHMESRYTADDRQNLGIATSDLWEKAGINIRRSTFSATDPDRRIHRATSQGVYFIGLSGGIDPIFQFITPQIRGPENNWNGANPDGYSNPAIDRLYAQCSVELDPAKRLPLLADFMKFLNEEVIDLPLFYNLGVLTAVRAGVRGPAQLPEIPTMTWNIHEWEMD